MAKRGITDAREPVFDCESCGHELWEQTEVFYLDWGRGMVDVSEHTDGGFYVSWAVDMDISGEERFRPSRLRQVLGRIFPRARRFFWANDKTWPPQPWPGDRGSKMTW